MSLRAFVPTLLLLCASCSNAVAASGVAESFWTQKDKGWFFYDDPTSPADPDPPPETRASAPVSEQTAPAPAPATPPGTFSAEWFRENLPKYKDAAWDNPTVENVRTFMLLQRFAMDRSSSFADATQLAVLGDPFLDETARRPSATFAAHALDKQAGQARSQVLSRIAESIGIFYFYASDCDLCQTQVPVVQMLDHRFTVTPISLDGKDLPGSPFPHFKTDQGHAQLLGVQRLPALFLASPQGEFAPIAQGALALGEIEHRITLAAASQGWIDQATLNDTRPLRNLHDNLSELLPAGLAQADSADPSGFIPPAVLLRQIESTLNPPP